MEFLLRYFVDGNEDCGCHVWSYTHAAQMIIPRIGERVWIEDDTCVEVDMVTYCPDCYDGDNLYMVDVECHNITDTVQAEHNEEEEY